MTRRDLLRILALGALPTLVTPAGALAALDFDGVDDQSSHGDITEMNGAANLSWSLWLKLDVFVAQAGVVMKGSNRGLVLSEPSEAAQTLGIFMDIGARVYAAANDLVVGEWAHWGAIYNGGGATNADKMKFRKNGVARTIVVAAALPTTFPAVGGSNLIAAGGSGFSNVQIALLRIWNATLSVNEMDQEMHSYRPVRTANLLLSAPYDDGVSARDYSGRGFHGTITGAVQSNGPPVSYGGEERRC